ncbi:hypothetical protein P6U16_10555 [Rhizobium sp. 32-5/1]|uniref:hypothetical protein n=1 Tax=Rhizobium sp. 32-5/1 TaxID=3019602 RepID=UPI00240D9826|nr:hypothetical protein [Rhizobium sp. 32-5/1]WEZ84919.1 hypothetical protein P6U16_10555 [Rhizobium sp. 32-5/1]
MSTLILKILRHARKKSRLDLVRQPDEPVKSLISKDVFLNISTGFIANRFSAAQEIAVSFRKSDGFIVVFLPLL